MYTHVGHLAYSGNMTNLLYHLWICYMEEHKALKYCDGSNNLLTNSSLSYTCTCTIYVVIIILH